MYVSARLRRSSAGPRGAMWNSFNKRAEEAECVHGTTEWRKGGKLRALARPGKQASRETGGWRRRRKQTEKAEQLTRRRKKDRLEDIFSPGKARDADTSSFLYLHFFPPYVLLFFIAQSL